MSDMTAVLCICTPELSTCLFKVLFFWLVLLLSVSLGWLEAKDSIFVRMFFVFLGVVVVVEVVVVEVLVVVVVVVFVVVAF